jgi:signal peptidase I
MKKLLLAIWEVAEVVIIAVATVFFIRTFVVQPFLVSGASMEPNFSGGDYLLIDEISYRFREPQRGEVVVFKYPNDPATFYIKRIIGLPGEKLTIKNGEVFVLNSDFPQGAKVKEDYLRPGIKTSGNVNVTLADNQYFVLGDNRNYSFDSRSWGPLVKDNIVGLVRLRLFPITKVQAFSY